MEDAIRQIGVSEGTFYRWRQELGGPMIEQVKRSFPKTSSGDDFGFRGKIHCSRDKIP